MKELKVVLGYDYSSLKKLISSTNEKVNLIVDISTCTNANQVNLFLVAVNSLLMNNNINILVNGVRVIKNYRWPSQVLKEQLLSIDSVELNVLPIINDSKLLTKVANKDCYDEAFYGFYHHKEKLIKSFTKVIKRLNSLYSIKRVVGQKCRVFESPTGYISYAPALAECPRNYYEYNLYYEVARNVNLVKLSLTGLDKIPTDVAKDIEEVVHTTWMEGMYKPKTGLLHLLEDGKPVLDYDNVIFRPRKETFFIKVKDVEKKKVAEQAPKISLLSENEIEELHIINRLFGITDDLVSFVEDTEIIEGTKKGFVRNLQNVQYIKDLIIDQDYDLIYDFKNSASIENTINDIDNIINSIEEDKFWSFIKAKLLLLKEDLEMRSEYDTPTDELDVDSLDL